MLWAPNNDLDIQASLTTSSHNITIVAKQVILAPGVSISSVHPKGKIKIYTDELRAEQEQINGSTKTLPLTSILDKESSLWSDKSRHFSKALQGKAKTANKLESIYYHHFGS